LGSLNSTDVTAELFFRGHRVDRRRLANVADALWPNGEIRESPRLPRFYTPAQVDQVELALTLLDSDFGIQLEDLAKAAQHSSGVIETLRAVIQGRHGPWTHLTSMYAGWPRRAPVHGHLYRTASPALARPEKPSVPELARTQRSEGAWTALNHITPA